METPLATNDPTASTGSEGALAAALAVSSARAPARNGAFERLFGATPGSGGFILDDFLKEDTCWNALAVWLENGARLRGPLTGDNVGRLLARDVAHIDVLINRQLNVILHHPSFQRLEASWRGLRYLVEQAPEGLNIKFRLLNVSWKELYRDVERALEFDQSLLFRKVYGEEFGTPGGEPFGVLLGDYEMQHKPSADHPTEDIGALVAISEVAAASFAPFITGAHPALLDLESFAGLEKPLNLPKTFEQVEYMKWRSFRHLEDTRFVGLTMPRVLMRVPYRDNNQRTDGFRFREDVEDPSRKNYLWGTAVYAFGAVLVRAFAESGWLAAIRGVQRNQMGGGLVTGLPTISCPTDRPGLVTRCSTDVIITDAQDKELGELGFICLSHCQDTDLAVFYGNSSVQRPKQLNDLAATINARLSAMLQYMLCVSRFAHYLKVIARDKVGSFAGAADCEDFLSNWLMQYISSNEKNDDEVRASYPLREGKVTIRERPDKPGVYACVIHLRPHFQLDQLVTSVKLTTQLAPPNQ